MNELLNEQIALVLEDLSLISNPYERSMVRVNLIKALTDLSPVQQTEEITGKDAIKADYAKAEAPAQIADVKEVVEETVTEEVEGNDEVLEPKEIDLDKSVAAGPIITTIEDEEGNPFEIDVTEVYNKLSNDLSDEDKLELAKNITAYSLAPVYDELTMLPDSNDKMMLAYYLQQLGLDQLNDFVVQLTDGQVNMLHEFVNKDNLEYLVNEIASAMEEE